MNKCPSQYFNFYFVFQLYRYSMPESIYLYNVFKRRKKTLFVLCDLTSVENHLSSILSYIIFFLFWYIIFFLLAFMFIIYLFFYWIFKIWKMKIDGLLKNVKKANEILWFWNSLSVGLSRNEKKIVQWKGKTNNINYLNLETFLFWIKRFNKL